MSVRIVSATPVFRRPPDHLHTPALAPVATTSSRSISKCKALKERILKRVLSPTQAVVFFDKAVVSSDSCPVRCCHVLADSRHRFSGRRHRLASRHLEDLFRMSWVVARSARCLG